MRKNNESATPISPATLGSRLLGGVIDVVVYAIIALACFVVGAVVLLISSNFGKKAPGEGAYEVLQVIVFLSAPIFDVVLLGGWVHRGRSFGKLVTNTRVIAADGRPISFLRGLARLVLHPLMSPTYIVVALLAFLNALGQPLAFAGGILAAAATIGGILSLVLMLTDKRHRALHDILAGTVVRRIM